MVFLFQVPHNQCEQWYQRDPDRIFHIYHKFETSCNHLHQMTLENQYGFTYIKLYLFVKKSDVIFHIITRNGYRGKEGRDKGEEKMKGPGGGTRGARPLFVFSLPHHVKDFVLLHIKRCAEKNTK